MNHLIIISIGMFFLLASAGGFSNQWETSAADEDIRMAAQWKSPGQSALHQEYISDLPCEKAPFEVDATERESRYQEGETSINTSPLEEDRIDLEYYDWRKTHELQTGK
jgi:hypothetical protein